MTKGYQIPYMVNTVDAILTMDEVLTQFDDVQWEKPPAWVKEQLLDLSVNGEIKIQDARRVLLCAQSSKLHPGRARGMDQIKQRWKKIQYRATT